MTKLVESLKRLYFTEKVSLVKLEELKANEKITQEEYEYIFGTS
ncbi:XkdX family protein [Vallitalea guaymasensis]|uniref:XkdX family protein n=1 Tax=Vallitalea guaymasensis TaxID=1185412 RepID=A0A8J8MBN9_9FIRM|nr:XkdX family protein [Vallitalea guaymasensis]QUH30001.1 XkdX family protein [Vallitalea guaymasensis]